jgi:hypothetical protein
MASKVLTRVYDYAMNGNVSAAKLFLDSVGHSNNASTNNTFIENQNTQININNTIITQEQVQSLSPEDLKQIEGLIKGKTN